MASSPESATLLARLGLDDVFGSVIFGAVLVLVLVSATAAMIHQARIVWRRTFRTAVPRSEYAFDTSCPADGVDAVLRTHHYLRVGTVEGHLRYLCHPWGLWGGLILHVGLVVALVAGFVALGTERRAITDLAVGEVYEPGMEWAYEEGGWLSSPLMLDSPLVVESVEPVFWPTDEVRQVTSVLRFLGASADDVLTIQVNAPQRHRDLTLYQSQNFGHTFLLEVAYGDEVMRLRADMPWPTGRAVPSYQDITFGDDRLQLRYYADVEQEGMVGSPTIGARYALGEERSDVATLTIGQSVQVGPLDVTLVDVLRWTRISVVRNHGIAPLFTGFFLIIFGSILIYGVVPREVYVMEHGGATTVTWRALRFRENVMGEFDDLLAECHGRRSV